MKLKTVRLPCGICITATVIPAEISPGRSRFSEYFGNHFNTGIKFKMNWIRLKFSHDRFTLLISEMNAINFYIFFLRKPIQIMINKNLTYNLVVFVFDIHCVLLNPHVDIQIGLPNKREVWCTLSFKM